MKVFLRGKKQKSGEARSFSFPGQVADLEAGVIKEHKMVRALASFGRALAKQMAKRGVECQGQEKEVLGVNLHSINFNLILKPTPKEDRW